MPNITTCTRCGKLYEESSGERADEPDRLCTACWRAARAALKCADPISAAVDDVLIDEMPDGLKAAIDAALAGGAPPGEILRRVRLKTGGPQAQPGGLTYLAVEAYLERRAKESPR